MTSDKRKQFFSSLSQDQAADLLYHWPFWARSNQLPPPGTWTHWLLLAGRGFGKTRTGAEWIRMLTTGDTPLQAPKFASGRLALVAPTAADARDVMVEGEGGLMSVCHPHNMPVYQPSKRKVTWPNGITAHLYSADKPERLRGPQHGYAWCDELCAWQYQQEAWDMLMFGLRLGRKPRTCITTTPKPTKMLKALIAQKNVHVTSGTTFDNLENLAPTFADEIIAKYEGTRLGRQELNAELLSDVVGALWNLEMVRQAFALKVGEPIRTVIAVDPAVTNEETSDATGIIPCSVDAAGSGIVHDDLSIKASPRDWATRVVNAYDEYEANAVVVEVNQGGDLVEEVLRSVGFQGKVVTVRASKGKFARAEPVASLYEQGKVSHEKQMTELEAELTEYVPMNSRKSPDRLDALVWGLSYLMIKEKPPEFRIRQVG